MSRLASKAELRHEILARLKALPQEYIQEQSARLRQKLRLDGVQRVCAYAPMAHEVNLLPLLAEAPDVEFYFPRCLPGRRLSFHRVRAATQLQPDAWGIPTPPPDLPQIEPHMVQLVIVPGVAFTAQGKRLGYGGGYYDRFLPLCPQAHTLALALPQQLYPELPTDAHDCTLQQVILP